MITVVTAERRRVFEQFSAARTLIGYLKTENDLQRANTVAFVVMPDHLHWLMQLGEGATLSQVVRGVKSLTSHRLGYPVWQRGYHAHRPRGGLLRFFETQAFTRCILGACATPIAHGVGYYEALNCSAARLA
jgi:REP element-mobilizing transposase RayT